MGAVYKMRVSAAFLWSILSILCITLSWKVDGFVTRHIANSSNRKTSISTSLFVDQKSLNEANTWKEIANRLSSSTDPTTTIKTSIWSQVQEQLQVDEKLVSLNLLESFIKQIDSLLSSLKEHIISQSVHFEGGLLPATIQDAIHSLQDTLQQLQQTVESATTSSTMTEVPSSTSVFSKMLLQLFHEIWQSLSSITFFTLDTKETVLVSTFVSFWIVSNILSWGQPPPPSQPYPLNSYDPLAARIYFDARPILAVQRSIEILVQSLQFAFRTSIIQNKLRELLFSPLLQRSNTPNNEEESESDNVIMEQEGIELAELLTRLGPTFIKVGQSLSIRSDLLPAPYIRGLATLQDRVPAFDTSTAIQILQDEWSVSDIYNTVLSNISPTPVAAASLGQVYKATLMKEDVDDSERRRQPTTTTTTVAIKVQRPNISTQIALDMHLLREMAGPIKKIFRLNTDTVGLVDAWGTGFVNELDYLQEAKNGEYFQSTLQNMNTPLKNIVLAPRVVPEYTTSKVLMTEWIDGERLDRSNKDDVALLCSICMNTYLTMLLEMGLLHCDPHPGNLLRTQDGKLCILDWGMVTTIPPQLQLTLIEHMAHLTSRDYAEIPRDLYLLGFVPPEKETIVQESGVVEVLADIYGQWTDGGGLATINANEVLTQIQNLAAEKGNLFQVPPYFAYIAKSFSVLEGIGLSNDPKYSIINECLPYVSNRLLTDNETMGHALSTFVFGRDKNNINARLLDTKRVEQLVVGYSNFTQSSASSPLLLANNNEEESTLSSSLTSAAVSNTRITTEMLEKVSDQVLDIILTEEETPLQQILIEQLVKMATANARMLWTEARLRSGVLPSGRTLLGTLVDPLGVFQTSPLVNADAQDERTVEMTRKLLEIFGKWQQNQQQQQSRGRNGNGGLDLQSLDRQEVLAFSRIITRKIWERRTLVWKSSNRVLRQVLELTAIRLETTERIPVKERRQTIGTSASFSSSSKISSKSQEHNDTTQDKRQYPDSATVGRRTKEKVKVSERLQSARDRLDSFSN